MPETVSVTGVKTTPPRARVTATSRESNRTWRKGPSTDERIAHLMAETLEEGLSRLRGRPVRIRQMRREFLRSSSSFRTERLHVVLDGGDPLRVFFKDLNPEHQLEKARTVREFDLASSRRELQMYQSILSPPRFGTLHLYASRWDDRGLYWIFLEDGGRRLLRSFAEVDRWTVAARWAARFHAATRDLPEAQTSFLPRYDHSHYRECAERVRQILPNLEAGERRLVSRGLDCYANCIDWLGARPRTVIHGQFFGQNIMLRTGHAGQEIAVIDWETAALGPGSFDLVSLSSGKWTKQQRHAMQAAYFEAYQAETRQPMDWGSFCRDLAPLVLYQSLKWLAWWGHHRRLSHKFSNFMKELGTVLEEHFATGRPTCPWGSRG